MATRKVVPFGGQLRLGSRGAQVKAVQRALARAGFGGKLSRSFGVFGVGTRTRVKKAQKTYGLPQTGIYGIETHARLAKWFADYEIFLYTGHNPNESPQARQRRLIVAAFLAFYAHGAHCHYTQSSLRLMIVRLRLRPPFESVELFEDCSSSVTGFYWIAGAEDPSRNDYDPRKLHYTGSLWDQGRLVTLEAAQPGDLVFYRSPSYPNYPYAHVGVYLGGGRVGSFGSEPPRILPIDYRTGAYGRVGIRSYIDG